MCNFLTGLSSNDTFSFFLFWNAVGKLVTNFKQIGEVQRPQVQNCCTADSTNLAFLGQYHSIFPHKFIYYVIKYCSTFPSHTSFDDLDLTSRKRVTMLLFFCFCFFFISKFSIIFLSNKFKH